MQIFRGLLSAAFLAAITLSAVPVAADPKLPAMLTNAQNLSASRISARRAILRGELESNDACHRVRFQAARPSIAPPTFLAERYLYEDGMCAQVITWEHASIGFAAPPGMRVVTVHAENGVFHVAIR